MIFITLYLGYILLVLFAAGTLARAALGYCLNGEFRRDKPTLSLAEVLLLGWVFVTTVAGFGSLFFPVNERFHIVLSGLLLGFAGWYWLRFRPVTRRLASQNLWLVRLLAATCLLAMIIQSGHNVAHYDTGLYHL